MTLMHTFSIETIKGKMPSNRYGTLEAIRWRFGDKVSIADGPPVEVDRKDLSPHWAGFARIGFKP
jgi:hypothetical protein